MKNSYLIGIGILASLLLYLGTRKIYSIMNRLEFIDYIAPMVKDASRNTGLFPSLFIAQAILESSDNKGVPANSSLSKEANNLFGIKVSKGWKGKYILKRTREVIKGKEVYVNAPFRKYDSHKDSIIDRVNFLTQNSRYKKHGVFSAMSPVDQAIALQSAGYATDPNYAKVLNNLIIKHDLVKYDLK